MIIFLKEIPESNPNTSPPDSIKTKLIIANHKLET